MSEKEINGEKVICDFESVETLERYLTMKSNSLYLYRRDLKTDEIVELPQFGNINYIPKIEGVIQTFGYDTHAFNECVELFNDVFETDDSYLPFDNDEIYITKEDRYEGCCTKDGFEFKTKDYHYFFGIKEKKYF